MCLSCEGPSYLSTHPLSSISKMNGRQGSKPAVEMAFSFRAQRGVPHYILGNLLIDTRLLENAMQGTCRWQD